MSSTFLLVSIAAMVIYCSSRHGGGQTPLSRSTEASATTLLASLLVLPPAATTGGYRCHDDSGTLAGRLVLGDGFYSYDHSVLV